MRHRQQSLITESLIVMIMNNHEPKDCYFWKDKQTHYRWRWSSGQSKQISLNRKCTESINRILFSCFFIRISLETMATTIPYPIWTAIVPIWSTDGSILFGWLRRRVRRAPATNVRHLTWPQVESTPLNSLWIRCTRSHWLLPAPSLTMLSALNVCIELRCPHMPLQFHFFKLIVRYGRRERCIYTCLAVSILASLKSM